MEEKVRKAVRKFQEKKKKRGQIWGWCEQCLTLLLISGNILSVVRAESLQLFYRIQNTEVITSKRNTWFFCVCVRFHPTQWEQLHSKDTSINKTNFGIKSRRLIKSNTSKAAAAAGGFYAHGANTLSSDRRLAPAPSCWGVRASWRARLRLWSGHLFRFPPLTAGRVQI